MLHAMADTVWQDRNGHEVFMLSGCQCCTLCLIWCDKAGMGMGFSWKPRRLPVLLPMPDEMWQGRNGHGVFIAHWLPVRHPVPIKVWQGRHRVPLLELQCPSVYFCAVNCTCKYSILLSLSLYISLIDSNKIQATQVPFVLFFLFFLASIWNSGISTCSNSKPDHKSNSIWQISAHSRSKMI